MSDPYDDADRKTMSELYDEIERLEAKAERSRVILDIAYERCMKAEDRVAELEAALRFYGKDAAWSATVIDSYSGEVTLFDWSGEIQDEPWEVAERALANSEGENNE